MRVGIIGAGLIGHKRATALLATGDAVVAVADARAETAQNFAEKFPGAEILSDGDTLVRRADLDAVIVATSNDALSSLAIGALANNKPVLIEKPAGRTLAELVAVRDARDKSGRRALVGFNHRFHPGMQTLRRRLPEIGELLYFRARYGHGGRVGYEKEWRANPAISGGGELIDQGCHLIDLCGWLGGEFRLQFGHAQTFYWPMPVDDNAFLLLTSPDDRRKAWLHASCTEWKNLFEFEAFGTLGRAQVCGLGRSYGPEEFRLFKINRENGAPDVETESFAGPDHSWELEWRAFRAAISGQPSAIATVDDAVQTMRIIDEVYRNSAK